MGSTFHHDHDAGQRPLQLIIHGKHLEPLPNGRANWSVDIHDDGDAIIWNTSVQDPLDEEGKELCRWYLEDYLSSPFSADRANDAQLSLKKYSQDLIRQLHLKDLATALLSCTPGEKRLHLDIAEDDTAGSTTSTIHQLYWELLEEADLWENDEIKINVRRTFQTSRSPTTLPRLHSWRIGESAMNFLNVLLVIGRETSTNPDPNRFNDALASTVLINIQKTLRNSKSPVKLNVEIARPGSFQALKDHLARAESLHGRGYYHIVHLDMHGQVGLREGHCQKFGFLYFSDPVNDGLKPCLARRVGRLLKQHCVPFAVLNACESAHANSGDDANIAKVFVSEGVQSVLAMTFKVSSQAAFIFLDMFYRQLLLCGSTFSAAVTFGRSALRRSLARGTRLDLQRERLDWFVPVVYSCGTELLLVESRCHMVSRLPGYGSGEEPTTEEPYLSITNPNKWMKNRDLDLLRLEKLLLQRGKAYVYGPPGVGKTTFLKHASSVWRETSFLHAVVFIDLTANAIFSAEDFASDILKQLWEQLGRKSAALLWRSETLSASSYDQKSLVDEILSLTATSRTAIILDGLHVTHSTWYSSRYVPGALNKSAKSAIGRILRAITGNQPSQSPWNRCLIICIGRPSDTRNMGSQLGIQLEECEFELRGLTFADSVELAVSVLGRSASSIDDWEQEDHDTLDLVLSLLQGLPAAILEVLPLAKGLNIPWRQFFKRLCHGLFSSLCELDSAFPAPSHVVQEFKQLAQAMPKQEFRILMFVALFWHEGPVGNGLASMELALRHNCTSDFAASEEDCRRATVAMELAVALGADRGYLRIGDFNATTGISPLFTIYGRAFAVASSAAALVEAGNLEEVHHPPNTERRLRELIVKEIQGTHFVTYTCDIIRGVEYEAMALKFSTTQANFLNCIDACSREDARLPLEKWPLYLFSLKIPFLNILLATAKERLLFAESIQQLLDAFFQLNGSKAVKPDLQIFVYMLIGYLVSTFLGLRRSSMDPVESLYQFMLQVVAASDQLNPEAPDIHTMQTRIGTMTSCAVWLVSKERAEEARSMLKEIVQLEDTVCNVVETLPPEGVSSWISFLNDKQAPAVISLLTGDDLTTFKVQSRYSANIFYEEMKQHYKARHHSRYISDLLQDVEPKDRNNNQDAPKSLTSYSTYLSDANKALELIGVNGIGRAREWWPKDFDVQAFLRDMDDLERLEGAQESGNWARAIEHQQSLLRLSCDNLNWAEALEHINSLEALYNKTPQFAEDLEDLKLHQQEIEENLRFFQSMGTLLEGSESGTTRAEKITGALPEFDRKGISSLERETFQNFAQLSTECGDVTEFTRAENRKTMEFVARGRRASPKFHEQFTTALNAFSTGLLATYTAFDSGDSGAIETALDEFETVSNHELIQDLFRTIGKPPPSVALRAQFESKRRYDDAFKRWSDATGAEDYVTALTCVSEMESCVITGQLTTHQDFSCQDAEPPLFRKGVGWLDWPGGCEETVVLQFLRHHINRFLLFVDEHSFCPSKRRRCITTPKKPIPGSVSKRKLDVGLMYNSSNELEESDRQSYDWSHILIPGELKSNQREDNYSSTWLDLLRYAWEIFITQDTHWFVLGFIPSAARLYPVENEKRWFQKSRSRSAGLGIGGVTLESSSSGRKRKRHGEAELHQSKRSRSGSSRRRADITSQVTKKQGGGKERANKYSVEEPKATSLMPPRDADNESFDNRIFCCLVVSPPGRAIHEFESVLEYLEVCRDVIKGHRSLYQDGKILHRDISKNNIIITDAEKEEDPSGMLIDLDLAKELDSGPSGARHRTCTMEFMAIEVLEGRAHTYRHDLESFFYVFLWVIIRYGQGTDNDLPTKSRLQGWYTGTYDEIARNKTGDMDKRGFKNITAEFPPQFEGVKHLAEELRRVLFPIRDEALFTGTYGEPKWINIIYNDMVNAFDSAIETYRQ
ncbi:MAG: hypothetical protein M1839_003061 [Geoglossum umbratile]|nr:MAG: hypothetical protein M1839_003061 [Geoglossum umbratile]